MQRMEVQATCVTAEASSDCAVLDSTVTCDCVTVVLAPMPAERALQVEGVPPRVDPAQGRSSAVAPEMGLTRLCQSITSSSTGAMLRQTCQGAIQKRAQELGTVRTVEQQ